MKTLLATIIAALLTVGCGMIEGEQTTADTSGGGSSTPTDTGGGSASEITGPTQLSRAISISAGGQGHTCAVVTNDRLLYVIWAMNWVPASDNGTGDVYCWGGNTGHLYFESGNRNVATYLSGLSDTKSLATGAHHTCALSSDKTVQCGGTNNYGELGDGTFNNSYFPTSVLSLDNVTALSASSNQNCALLDNGTIRCWGHNSYGQLGDGNPITNPSKSNIPLEVAGITNATSLALGSMHACALLSDSTVKCWGSNGEDQLGDGTGVSSSTPVTVSSLSGVIAIGAGSRHTCAVHQTILLSVGVAIMRGN